MSAAGYSSISLLPNAVTQLLALGGTELTNSRRVVDLYDCGRGRVQFAATAAISIRLEFSLDYGVTWVLLWPEGSYQGDSPYNSAWFVLPDECKAYDVTLRAIGVGSGRVQTVHYVQFDFD